MSKLYLVGDGGVVIGAAYGLQHPPAGAVAVDADVYAESVIGEPLRWPRLRRNALLAASDWTQLADAAVTATARAEWSAYRSALRDLPETCPSPVAVAWPAQPAA